MTAQALAFAVAWTLAEPLRGALGLQFPWNPIAVVWAVTDQTMQATAFTGTYGLSLLTVAAASLTAPWFLAGRSGRAAALTAPLLLVPSCSTTGALRLKAAPELADTDVRLRVVQPDIEQHHKWDPEKRIMWLRGISSSPPWPTTRHRAW